LFACLVFGTKLLEKILERAEWTTYQETERKKAEDEAEKEREAYASIDWHDFAVIGVIEFTGEEDVTELPPPVDLATLLKRSLVEKKTMPLIHPQVSRASPPPPPSSRNEIQVCFVHKIVLIIVI
jgi:splicing factor 3A subunit 1